MNVARDRFATLKDLQPVTTLDDVWPQDDRDASLRCVTARADGPPGLSHGQAIARRPAPVRRRLVLAGALAVVLGGAVAVPTLSTGPTYAATPPMLKFQAVAGQQSARTVLTEMARKARTQPAPNAQARYEYIHTKGWYLHESADVDKGILDSGIAEIDRQLWLAPDGSGRLLRNTTNDNPPMINPDKTLKPGEFDSSFLPAGATEATVQSKYRHPATAAGWAHTIEDLWNQQTVAPALHARLLDTLAAQAGVTLLGDTTDRVSRRGVAVSAEDGSPRERLILVFNPDTAALLDAETVVLQDSDLPVQPPATISYTVWITTGYTNTTTSQP